MTEQRQQLKIFLKAQELDFALITVKETICTVSR